MTIRLIIDTCADLEHSDLDDDVIIMPIPVFIDGKEYIPFVNLSNSRFYELQKEARSLPHTSQAPLARIYEAFAKCIRAGEEVIAIFMGSAHSGTYSSACVAREQIGDEMGAKAAGLIHIIDSKNVTFPYAALVFEAYKMIRSDAYKAEDIVSRIEYLVPRIKMRAFIDDLMYLRLGGRISGATAAIGNLLNFKIVIKTGDNLIVATDKLRGIPNALRRIVDTAAASDIDYSLPSYIGHTNAPERAQKLLELTESHTDLRPARIISIGPTVGTHVGPGSTGLCWFVR